MLCALPCRETEKYVLTVSTISVQDVVLAQMVASLDRDIKALALWPTRI